MAYLREHLNNFGIQLQTRIADAPEEKKLYTSRDKYFRLVEKNPKIQDFKQRLDLDIEM